MKNPFLTASFIILLLAGSFSTLQAQSKGSVTNFGNKWGWTGTNEAFVPQLVMYGNPSNFYNNPAKIDSDIQTFIVDHGFSGFHVSVYYRWFDLDEEDCTSISGSNPNIDVRTFDALESVSEPVQPGDIVELDPNKPRHYRKARDSSKLVAGVITTRPGFTLGNYSEKPQQLNVMTAEKGLRSIADDSLETHCYEV